MYVPSPTYRIWPVVSAALADVGTEIMSPESSAKVVRSPLLRRIAGEVGSVTAVPLQSVNRTLTGRTWLFLSLSVMRWFVIGARNVAAPMLVDVDAVSDAPSASVTLLVIVRHPAVVNDLVVVNR